MTFTSRTYTRTHARANACTRSITNVCKHKRMQMEINARKLIVAIDAWAISGCKRNCVLCFRSKTFRIYYTTSISFCTLSFDSLTPTKSSAHNFSPTYLPLLIFIPNSACSAALGYAQVYIRRIQNLSF